jgi:hypothetical protein
VIDHEVHVLVFSIASVALQIAAYGRAYLRPNGGTCMYRLLNSYDCVLLISQWLEAFHYNISLLWSASSLAIELYIKLTFNGRKRGSVPLGEKAKKGSRIIPR